MAPSTIPESSTLPLVAEIPRASNTDGSAQHISESVSQAAKAHFPLMRQGKTFPFCGWRGYEREEKEGEREVDNLSTCGCVIQLYLWENTRFIEIREFGWGF